MLDINPNGGQPSSLESLFDRIAEIGKDPEKTDLIEIGALRILRFNEPESQMVGTLGNWAPKYGQAEIKVWDNNLPMGDPSLSIGIDEKTGKPYLRPANNLHFQRPGTLHWQALLCFLDMTKKFAPEA
jgi:hypothetical protein